MSPLPPVRKRQSYADVSADDLTFALYHDRVAPRDALGDQEPPMPATKASRRHSEADMTALKACRTHLRDAVKALDDAGAPDLDGDGVPDVLEAKALNYDQAARAVRDAWYAQHPSTGDPAKMPSYVETAYDSAVIVSDDGQLYRVSYRQDGERYTFAPRGAWEIVRQAYLTADGQEVKAVPAIAPDAHTGAMVAVILDAATQATLRGLLPAALQADAADQADHMTVCYLGGPAAAMAQAKPALLRALADITEEAGPIRATLGGLARFPASETSDGMDVLVVLVDAPGLDDLRVAVADAATEAGIDLPGDHGFIPHITLAYIDPETPTPEVRMARAPLALDALSLVWAGERIDLPLLGMDEEEEDDGEPAAHAERVQRQALAMAPAGEIKMLADGRLLVPGIRYGGRDLVGDTFTKATDLGAARSFVGMPVYYDHAQRGIKSQIGHVAAYEATDEGIDFVVELDRNHKYKATIAQLYDAKALGGTTGALPHLVVRDGGELKRWIIGELSVSPTPAEPRNLPSTKAAPEIAPEAAPAAAGDAAARLLALTYSTLAAYRLRRRYGQ